MSNINLANLTTKDPLINLHVDDKFEFHTQLGKLMNSICWNPVSSIHKGTLLRLADFMSKGFTRSHAALDGDFDPRAYFTGAVDVDAAMTAINDFFVNLQQTMKDVAHCPFNVHGAYSACVLKDHGLVKIKIIILSGVTQVNAAQSLEDYFSDENIDLELLRNAE